MKLLFVLLPFAAVLYAVAENEKCFKYGLTSADCNSGEAKIQHPRADSGPPGNDGEKGKPCESSNGHEALKKALEDSAQSINNNWKRFQDILKMIDQLKHTCVKAANSGQSQSSGGGNSDGGFTDEGKVKFNNLKYQYFDYSVSATEAWEMCQEKGGQLAFVNLLTPDDRKKMFKKLKIKEHTSVWINGVGTVVNPPYIQLGFMYWSRVYLRNDLYKRFGFSTIPKQFFNQYKVPGCLRCQASHCRIVNGYSEKAKVICQYPFSTPPGPATTIIPFNKKLFFGQARQICQRFGGELAFKFLKNPKTLREFLKRSYDSNTYGLGNQLDGEYWIGAYLVDGTAHSYRYLDGTSIGDHAKFPWIRPRYPGYWKDYYAQWFYKGTYRTSFRFDKHAFRNNFFIIKNSIRQCLVLKVNYDNKKKSMEYGIKTSPCTSWSHQHIKTLCEFTKPPGNQSPADLVVGSIREFR